MEKTPENSSSNNPLTHNPAQNELDLGFNQIEPITPKKIIKPEPSIFDRAKNVFAKKENNDFTQPFSVRKEPTFGQPASINPVKIDGNTINIPATESSLPKMSATGFTDAMKNAALHSASEKNVGAESSETLSVKNDIGHDSAELEKAKAFMASLEEAATQNNPTETEKDEFITNDFIARDEEPLEAVENDERPIPAPKASLKNPENWSLMQKLPVKHRRLFVAISGFLILLVIFFWLKPSSHTVEDFQVQNNSNLPIEFQPLTQDQTTPQPQVALTDNIEDHVASLTRDNEPQAIHTLLASEAVMFAKQTTVLSAQIHEQSVVTGGSDNETQATDKAQHDTNRATDKAKTADNKTVEPKTTQTRTQTTVKNERQQPPVTDVKPKTTNTATVSSGNGTSKTLIVPQGVSLMQVFRNNNLNIADVNAMTKAPGAGNVLSNFNPGDRVQVVINEQGRVSSLRLSNGGTFIRQANGTYRYQR